MIYTKEVENMCPVAKGAKHEPAPIPEEGKWVHSKKIEDISVNYNSSITFIIGGSLGISQELLNMCKEKICFSKMTFPHQLIRVFLLEQIFRGFKILNNETYHR